MKNCVKDILLSTDQYTVYPGYRVVRIISLSKDVILDEVNKLNKNQLTHSFKIKEVLT